MCAHYRLHPPFLYVPEEATFSTAWESFCCKLLNISNATDSIYIRNPPEQGVDLFFPEKGIAYQCKSVESGKSGDFNVTKAVSSWRSALKVQDSLGWKNYTICTNVSISGSAEETLKKEIPGVTILPSSYWINLCEKHSAIVERNFRRLVDIPTNRVLESIRKQFTAIYSSDLAQKMKKTPYKYFSIAIGTIQRTAFRCLRILPAKKLSRFSVNFSNFQSQG